MDRDGNRDDVNIKVTRVGIGPYRIWLDQVGNFPVPLCGLRVHQLGCNTQVKPFYGLYCSDSNQGRGFESTGDIALVVCVRRILYAQILENQTTKQRNELGSLCVQLLDTVHLSYAPACLLQFLTWDQMGTRVGFLHFLMGFADGFYAR